jgi:NDP-sugar pyrophosphorylase family protein
MVEITREEKPPRKAGTEIAGLIMAGGRSDRMRSTLGPAHKALVPVLGTSMLERNICSFVAKGVRRIVVAINAHETGIEEYLRSRGKAILASVGGTIECLKEEQPLGTVGAVRELEDKCSQLVVTNVDNLTTLNWIEMLSYHRRRGAAMTIAAHTQPFQVPLGELEVQRGNVLDYHEKPWKEFLISSGAYVLNAAICGLVPRGHRTDVPDLVKELLGSRQSIAAFVHSSAWIDVNEASSVVDAERLVAENFGDFGCWHPSPQAQRLQLVIRSDLGILVEKRHSKPTWVEGEWVLPGEAAVQSGAQAAIEACKELGLNEVKPRSLGAYDEIDEHDGTITRYPIFLVDTAAFAPKSAGAERVWLPLDHWDERCRLSQAMRRSVALLGRLQ